MKRVLLIGRHQNIEPLGVIALCGVARDAGWERDVVLVKNGDFGPAVARALETRPDLVAFSVWTGFHLQSFAAADTVRAAGLKVAIGGPHATYNPQECVPHADFVSKGEGFRTFRLMLEGNLSPGVHFDDERLADGFPFPDRSTTYDRYPDLAGSPIKSIIASIGCPYTCVAGDTRVFTADGPRTMAQLAEGPDPAPFMVATSSGMAEATRFLHQGLRETFTVNAGNGMCLTATADHRVLTLRYGTAVWVEIGDLVEDDWLVMQAGELAHRPGVDRFYARVRSVKPAGVQPVYDLTVPDGENFIASGFIAHNCSYCNSPQLNVMYGGFSLNLRPIDDVIREAQEIRDRWPAQLIYFQDDVFGFRLDWLEELARRWPAEVGTPWHCQMRLEMTKDERRLDLFKTGGCTGITLAIESGNDWLRRYVLQRGMADNLIVEGIRKIQARGIALRTEQILAVPFSDLSTDLETLELNVRLNPEMAWTSILAPYVGLPIGDVAKAMGMYDGTNDLLTETFFDRSVLRHVKGGWRSVQDLVTGSVTGAKDNPLLRLKVIGQSRERDRAVVGVDGGRHVTIEYLKPAENALYAGRTVLLHQLFYWLAKLPFGADLGWAFTTAPADLQTWASLGRMAEAHLAIHSSVAEMALWKELLRVEMGVSELPLILDVNPWYFVFLPSGGELANEWLRDGILATANPFPQIGYRTRQWLFHRALYKTIPARKPIAHSGNGVVA